MVVVLEDHANALVIHVDPVRPDAWRQEPFYSDIRRWARAAARKNRQVIVWQGDTKFVISPDGPAGTPSPWRADDAAPRI